MDARWRTAATVGAAAALAVLLGAGRAAAIPVFARIYDKPCSACHTVYPQLNPAGEAFRAHGLHGITPADRADPGRAQLRHPGHAAGRALLRLRRGRHLHRRCPAKPDSTVSHFNLNFLGLLSGGELGPLLRVHRRLRPALHDPADRRDPDHQPRPGHGVSAGARRAVGWLAQPLRLGLFELPLGQSPRVHRLTVRPYLIYDVTAFGLLGQQPPVMNRRNDSLVLVVGPDRRRARVARSRRAGCRSRPASSPAATTAIDNNVERRRLRPRRPGAADAPRRPLPLLRPRHAQRRRLRPGPAPRPRLHDLRRAAPGWRCSSSPGGTPTRPARTTISGTTAGSSRGTTASRRS